MSRPQATPEAEPQGISSQVGPWGMVPAWVLLVKDKNGKGLSCADLRVYIALRSFADRWGAAFPHVPTIAARADVTPRTAEKSITRFRELGLLATKRRYRTDGSIAGCDYQLRDIPPSPLTEPEEAEGVPSSSTVPPGEADGTPRPDGRSNNTPGEHTRETPQRTDQNCSPSGRFAPSGAGAGEDEAVDDPPISTDGSEPKNGSWWIEDRNKFRQIIGDIVVSDGVNNWKRGVFPVDEVYSALRQRPKGRIIKPGSYVTALLDKPDGMGLENWLLGEGFSMSQPLPAV